MPQLESSDRMLRLVLVTEEKNRAGSHLPGLPNFLLGQEIRCMLELELVNSLQLSSFCPFVAFFLCLFCHFVALFKCMKDLKSVKVNLCVKTLKCRSVSECYKRVGVLLPERQKFLSISFQCSLSPLHSTTFLPPTTRASVDLNGVSL